MTTATCDRRRFRIGVMPDKPASPPGHGRAATSFLNFTWNGARNRRGFGNAHSPTTQVGRQPLPRDTQPRVWNERLQLRNRGGVLRLRKRPQPVDQIRQAVHAVLAIVERHDPFV